MGFYPAIKTVLHIVEDAGFNSKSTFNRVFKQMTGFTPMQYRQAG